MESKGAVRGPGGYTTTVEGVRWRAKVLREPHRRRSAQPASAPTLALVHSTRCATESPTTGRQSASPKPYSPEGTHSSPSSDANTRFVLEAPHGDGLAAGRAA